jgi:DNA-directed RNA polymerase subunit L
MELVVLEEGKDKLVAELPGLDNTFCNNLKKELYADAAVKEASYVIKHPLLGTPTFLLHTDGKRAPRAALKDACKRIKDQNKEFLAAFKKVK